MFRRKERPELGGLLSTSLLSDLLSIASSVPIVYSRHEIIFVEYMCVWGGVHVREGKTSAQLTEHSHTTIIFKQMKHFPNQY